MSITVQQQEIDVQLAACRAAWARFFTDNNLQPTAIRFTDDTPIWAWCLHHSQLVELLEEPVENRIAYILLSKSFSEQACRFLNLRPMSLTSIKVCDAAWAEYYKVRSAAHKADVPNHTWNGTSIFNLQVLGQPSGH